MNPVPKIDWNTAVSVITLVIMLAGGGYFINDLKRNDVESREWHNAHMDFHASRRAEVASATTAVHVQIGTMDDRMDAAEAVLDRQGDRISAAEARRTEDAQALRDLQTAVNTSNVKLEVILSWIEEQRRRETPQ
jgi:hypothetical protein